MSFFVFVFFIFPIFFIVIFVGGLCWNKLGEWNWFWHMSCNSKQRMKAVCIHWMCNKNRWWWRRVGNYLGYIHYLVLSSSSSSRWLSLLMFTTLSLSNYLSNVYFNIVKTCLMFWQWMNAEKQIGCRAKFDCFSWFFSLRNFFSFVLFRFVLFCFCFLFHIQWFSYMMQKEWLSPKAIFIIRVWQSMCKHSDVQYTPHFESFIWLMDGGLTSRI